MRNEISFECDIIYVSKNFEKNENSSRVIIINNHLRKKSNDHVLDWHDKASIWKYQMTKSSKQKNCVPIWKMKIKMPEPKVKFPCLEGFVGIRNIP